MVLQALAVMLSAVNAKPIVVHADHINMVKFILKEDNGYKTVSGHLQIIAQNASNVISTQWEEEGRVSKGI